MKSFFIINPAAGKEAGKQEFIKKAEDIGQKLKMNVSVYTTKEKGDGFRFVREVCSTFRGEELRFFACGGDGTMNEVINALDGTEKVSFGVVPLGTGNDFVRNGKHLPN